MMATDVIGPVVAEGWTMHGSGSGWWMGGMMFGMIIFWAAIILGIVWLVRASIERRPPSGQDAFAILDRRYAEGAISVDEYREHRASLTDEHVRRRNRRVAPSQEGGWNT